MNYLSKYWENNIPTFDPNYFRDHPQGNYFGCEYWAFASKIFQPSCSFATSPFIWNLPHRLSSSDYSSLIQQIGKGLDEIVETLIGDNPTALKWSTKEHCVFHTYFDYMEYAEVDSNGTISTFRKKERYGKFVN